MEFEDRNARKDSEDIIDEVPENQDTETASETDLESDFGFNSASLSRSGYKIPGGGGDSIHHLPGMYQSWFLEYASYVILERAVPHINDGLKPVQRRILHSMKRLDDGRYNKVANIIGHTMQFHPHGDASIGDALVQLGQKDL
jgi:topoisomerase-4 subunit A